MAPWNCCCLPLVFVFVPSSCNGFARHLISTGVVDSKINNVE